MKILISTDSFERRTGGTALLPNFALHINALYPQHEVRIMTNDVSQSYDKVFKIEFIIPFIVRFFDPLIRNITQFRALKKIRQAYEFDVVIFNNAADGVLYKLLSADKKKVMGLIHDDDSLRLNLRNRPTYLFGYWIRQRLEKKAIKIFDNILCPSNYIKEIVLTELDKPDSKIKLFYQSIDIESVTFKLQNKTNNQPLKILFVKSAFMRGRLVDLIDALSLLNNYHFQLTVVGENNNVSLRHIIDGKIALSKHLEAQFLGYCTPETVSKLMYEHDIFCVPALAEALGLANVEALAHGLSVVSTNVGGIPEVLDNGNNGWLAEPYNPKSLADALRQCIEAGPSVLEVKKVAGRRFVEAHFDYRPMLKRLIDICENKINN